MTTNATDPSYYAVAVTPSDSTSLLRTVAGVNYAPRSIYVGGAGAVNVEWADGTNVTFSGVAAGQVLPIRPVKVRSTSTTATLIVAIY